MDGSFKMRHAYGGQSTKFCKMIFDLIDKIMYRNTRHEFVTKNTSAEVSGFTRHGIEINLAEKKVGKNLKNGRSTSTEWVDTKRVLDRI